MINYFMFMIDKFMIENWIEAHMDYWIKNDHE